MMTVVLRVDGRVLTISFFSSIQHFDFTYINYLNGMQNYFNNFPLGLEMSVSEILPSETT